MRSTNGPRAPSELSGDFDGAPDRRSSVADNGHGDNRQRHWGGRRASRGPTPELKQAADVLAVRVARGEPVNQDDVRQLRSLVALDLIRSGRPTARAKGFELLEKCVEPTAEGPQGTPAAVDETPF